MAASIIDNVFIIPKNKNIGKWNYNAGKVIIKCLINAFCPFESGQWVDNDLTFADTTIQTYNEEVLQNLSFVPGLEGVFLKEKYNYRSNFLCWSGDSGSWVQDSDCLQPEKVTSKPPYMREQMWHPDPDVVTNTMPPKPTDYLHLTTIEKATMPQWKYERPNASTFDDKSSAAISDEEIDSCILMPCQVAANPLKCKINPNGSTSEDKQLMGIHWKVTKDEPLFKGEDFWVEFRRVAIATDIANVESKPFKTSDPIYKALDVYDPDRGSEENPPKNWGVVSYETEWDDEGETSEYKLIEDSQKLLDLHKQAYYVIEFGMGSKTQNYFIFIPQRDYPTFVKVIDGISYSLGKFKEVSGKDLMEKDRLRVTVRNHLGKLVITFMGHEDTPWIVENIPVDNEDINELPILQVAEGPISLWGGNVAAGYIFGILQYNEEFTLNTPPVGENGKPDILSLPAMAVKMNLAILSTNDFGLMKDGESAVAADVKNFLDIRKPFFTLDALVVKESKWTPSKPGTTCGDDSGQAKGGKVQSLDPPKPSHFMDLKDFLRADSNDKKSELDVEIIPNEKMNEEEPQVFHFTLKTTFKAGDHTCTSYKFTNCITPILTNIRLVSVPAQADLWCTDPQDVTHHVMTFSDQWSSSDFHKIEHTGSIKFLVNRGMMMRRGQRDMSDYILSLSRRQAFYIEFWAGYDGCSYQFLDNEWGFKLFTGICYGGTVGEEAGHRYVECQIVDYSKILEDSFFMNSPFFDGMKDFNAVFEILKMVQFKDGQYEPADLVKVFAEANIGQNELRTFYDTPDKRPANGKAYALPSGYSRLQSPMFKPSDGSKLIDTIHDFTVKSGKVMFFDAYGVFHYENLPFDNQLFGSGMTDSEVAQLALWYFTTATDQSPDFYGQTVFNVFTKEATVQDCINAIHILSTTPNFELVIGHNENSDSIRKQGSLGFLGYKKMFLQTDGIFGSETAVGDLIDHYKKLYKPPVSYKFETYGLPVRCFDICIINQQPLIIVNVSSTISAGSDGFKWWMNVEGEWYGGEKFVDARY